MQPLAIADRVNLGIQPTFGAYDTSGNTPLFENVSRCPMRLQVRGVDHYLFRLTALRLEAHEDLP
jgi:hypothetical protein